MYTRPRCVAYLCAPPGTLVRELILTTEKLIELLQRYPGGEVLVLADDHSQCGLDRTYWGVSGLEVQLDTNGDCQKVFIDIREPLGDDDEA